MDIIIDDMPVCRICYEPCDATSHCKCTGTMQYVHRECLDTWIRVSRRANCELCNAPFDSEAEEDEDCAECVNRMFSTASNIMLILFISMILIVFLCAVERT